MTLPFPYGKSFTPPSLSPLEAGRENYQFTLYRSMRIKSIKDETDTSIPFAREGELFSVQKADMPESRNITLTYEGSHPRFYCNDQAAALPAYFP